MVMLSTQEQEKQSEKQGGQFVQNLVQINKDLKQVRDSFANLDQSLNLDGLKKLSSLEGMFSGKGKMDMSSVLGQDSKAGQALGQAQSLMNSFQQMQQMMGQGQAGGMQGGMGMMGGMQGGMGGMQGGMQGGMGGGAMAYAGVAMQGVESVKTLTSGDSSREDKFKAVGSLAGTAVGAYFGGPAGAAVGAQVGAQVGEAAAGLFGGKAKSSVDRFAAALDEIAQSAKDYDESYNDRKETMGNKITQYSEAKGYLEGELQNRRDKVDDMRNKAALFKAQYTVEETSPESAGQVRWTNNEAESQYTAMLNAAAAEDQVVDDIEVAKKAKKEKYRQQIQDYGLTLFEDLRNLDADKEKYFQQKQQEDSTSSDYRDQAALVKDQIAQLGPPPDDQVDLAIYNDQLLKLKKQEFELSKQYFAAREKEIKAVEASLNQYKNFKNSLDGFMTQRARKDWKSQDYLGEYHRLQGELNSLDRSAEDYNQKALQLQQEQFDVLKNIDNLQQKEVAASQQIVKALEEAKGRVDNTIEGLLESSLSPEQSFGHYLEKYGKLWDQTQSTQGEDRVKAVGEFTGFVEKFLSEAQKTYKSTEKYKSVFDSVVGDLKSLSSSLDGEASGKKQEADRYGVNLDQMYANFTNQFNGSLNQLQGSFDQMNAELKENYKTGELGAGFADGGIATGPQSGHVELLHGTEAIIPLKNGAVPVQLNQAPSRGEAQPGLLAELKEQNRRLGKLIDITRANQGAKVKLEIKDKSNDVIKTISEGSRRGVVKLGTP